MCMHKYMLYYSIYKIQHILCNICLVYLLYNNYDVNIPYTGNFPGLGFRLPKLTAFGVNNNNNTNSPGYFDILYIDDDMLIISQNEPGGVFVSIRDTTQSVDELLAG